MPISIFQQAGEPGPKRYSYQLCLDKDQIDIGPGLGLVRRKFPG